MISDDERNNEAFCMPMIDTRLRDKMLSWVVTVFERGVEI